MSPPLLLQSHVYKSCSILNVQCPVCSVKWGKLFLKTQRQGILDKIIFLIIFTAPAPRLVQSICFDVNVSVCLFPFNNFLAVLTGDFRSKTALLNYKNNQKKLGGWGKGFLPSFFL